MVRIPTVCGGLREVLSSLDKDRAFLKAGDVFNGDFIDSDIELKMADVQRFEMTPDPVEVRNVLFVLSPRVSERRSRAALGVSSAPRGMK
jgi:glutamine synthetase